MDSKVTVWASNFYGTSLGNNPIIDIQDPSNESMILKEYAEYFEKPLAYMLTGTDVLPDNKEQLNNALVKISQGPITDWIYLLRFLVDNKFFEYTGDFISDFDNCVTRIKDEMRVMFATTGIQGKDIALHTYNGRIIDRLPKKLLVYPKGLRAHYGGKLLKDLASKVPTTTNSVERALLSQALSGEFLSSTDLALEKVTVPVAGGGEMDITVDATHPQLPPKDYTDISKALPQSVLDQGNTRFSLVKEHCMTEAPSSELKAYLDKFDGVPTSTEAVLDDETVLNYLASTRGIYVNSLDDITVSNAAILFGATELPEDLLAGSAAELLSALNQEEQPVMTTLDVLVANYCKENKIDVNCSIQQLLDNIERDTNPVPPSLNDMLVDDMAAKGIVGETTLDEYLKGTKHWSPDPTDFVLDYIADNPLLGGEEIERAFRTMVLQDKPLELPKPVITKEDLVAYIKVQEYPSTVQNALLNAVENPFGAAEKLQSDKVEDKPLTLDELCKVVDMANVPLDIKSAALEFLRNPMAVNNSNNYNESGYIAGRHLLLATRKALSADASWQTREAYTPVLYAFLRLLMCDVSKEKESVVEFLEGKINEASGKAKTILQEAKEML